jgi:hypothetical protein
MKETEGTNIGLVYTSFLKFQYNNKHSDLCETLNIFIPFCENRVNECQKECDEMELSNKNDANPFDKFMLELLTKTLNANKEYVVKLRYMKKIVCN